MSVKPIGPARPPNVQLLQIEEDFAGQRVDNYLLRLLKGVPKSRIYRIIRKGEVRLNGKRIKPDTRLQTGDRLRVPPVRVSEGSDTRNIYLEKSIEKTILYEDKDNSIQVVTFSNDGKLFASGDKQGNVRIWNMEDKKLIQTLGGHYA
ncbi:MAG: hypothetical protein IIA75_07470, partial [Proteobacteria bacterium]|nr:hypothetical protein [Pseudomonadota bacterium]